VEFFSVLSISSFKFKERSKMPIKLILYGDLLQKSKQEIAGNSNPLTVHLPYEKMNSVYDILERLSINENEISHIFVNHKFCGPGIELKDGDRVALFPRRMALMFEEIPHSNSMEVMVKLSDELRECGPKLSLVDVPRGSDISKVLKKFNIPLDKGNLRVMVNDVPWDNNKYILKENDVVKIF
jgi:molybdopterin converting factor small subunit